jgi:hypothetical protein
VGAGGAYRVLVGKMREREYLEDLDLKGRTLLKCIFKKSVEKARTGLIWLSWGQEASFCECDCQLLKNNCAPWS